MNKLDKLIEILADEYASEYQEKIDIPTSESEKYFLYKTLVNIRLPKEMSEEYLSLEDQYLKEQLEGKIIDINNFLPGKLFLYKGDITKLNCDAIVNPGNEKGIGCFEPSHDCLDNKINTNAGMRLRLACNKIMVSKNYHLDVGSCIITDAYNLPCKYVIETVGPAIKSSVLESDKEDLKKCYINALELAKENNIRTIAFPCISTGVFNFPNKDAAFIAVDTVKKYLTDNDKYFDRIIFCTYKDIDYNYYKLFLKN